MAADFRPKSVQGGSSDSLAGRVDGVRRALAEELEQYGAMLVAIEGQHDAIMAQSSSEVLQSVSKLNAQVQRTNQMCAHRQQLQENLARSLSQPADAPFSTIIPLLAARYRPAFQALVHENNALRTRIQRCAQRNQLLLAKSLEVMQALAGPWTGRAIAAAPGR